MPSERPIVVEDGVDLSSVLRLMWKYRYSIALTSFLGALIAAYIALTTPPVFQAEVVITEVRDDGVSSAGLLSGQLGGLAGLAGLGGLMNGSENYEARATLNSRRLVEEFIRRNDLLPVLYPGAAQRPSLWFAVRRFREDVLSIRDDKRSGTIIVAVAWTDPAVAARWANQFVALANQTIRVRTMNDSKRSIAFLNEQIAHTDVVERQQVMYNLIEVETKKLMFANVRPDYAFAIADPAVAPEQRVRPKRTLIVLAGLVIGMLFGTVAALVVDLMRRSRSTGDRGV